MTLYYNNTSSQTGFEIGNCLKKEESQTTLLSNVQQIWQKVPDKARLLETLVSESQQGTNSSLNFNENFSWALWSCQAAVEGRLVAATAVWEGQHKNHKILGDFYDNITIIHNDIFINNRIHKCKSIGQYNHL